MDYLNITFRAGTTLTQPLQTRSTGSVHQVAKESLERYFKLLKRASRALVFTAPEAEAILTVLNGTLFTADMIPYLVNEIADSLQRTPRDGVAADVLLQKLQSLGVAEMFALADAVERYWHAATTAQPLTIGQLFTIVEK